MSAFHRTEPNRPVRWKAGQTQSTTHVPDFPHTIFRYKGGQSVATATPGPAARRGRPRKFEEPSKVVTLTLPESTLRDLGQLNPDRACAIVQAVRHATNAKTAVAPDVDVVEMVPGTGLIVVGASRLLKRIPFLHLVEIAPGRFLLAMEPGHDFRRLEVAIRDLFEDVRGMEPREQRLLEQLLDRIRTERRSERVRMAEILFVRLRK